jgi:hypothetical protein
MKYIHASLILITLTMCNEKSKTLDTKAPTENQPAIEKSEDIPTANWVKAKCEHLCDEEKGRNVSREDLLQHLNDDFYDLVQQEQNDSIFISFDFIKNCCMDFTGTASIKEDTLLLAYQIPHDSLSGGCDCSCDYRMHYRINKKGKTWSIVKPVYNDIEL